MTHSKVYRRLRGVVVPIAIAIAVAACSDGGGERRGSACEKCGASTWSSVEPAMAGRFQAALEAADKVQTPSVLYGAVARAMAHAQLGQMNAARGAVAEIAKIDPHYLDHVREDLAKRNHVPAIIDAIMSGLKKAGLQCAPGSHQ